MDESSNRPSYREFMRARRPHLFSDTLYVEVSEMDRRQFEFHLHSLTSRKEETAFENFARALAQKELCPNLIPQTGPTGGGDSKVDTETYPVAPELATLWYEGEPAAASERWAFAVSAKADWKPKLKSDVAKIVATGRPYKRIYFVSNQAIKDKERAELEDALTKQHGVPVHILDRSWIVAKVIENRRWDLVAETLQFELSKKLVARPGPIDTGRQLELEALDKRIDEVAATRVTLEVIEEALQSALLARGLERPRVEVAGRFDRAERLARNIGSTRQLTRIWYQRAWTALFWFNDLDEGSRLYDLLAGEVLDSDWVWDVEDVVNLWLALQTGRPPDDARTSALRAALQRHDANKGKETSSLWARTQLLLMDLVAGMRARSPLEPTFKALRQAIADVRRQVEFPLEPLVRIFRELGDVLGDEAGFDELLDDIVVIERERSGDRAAGELQLERGLQKLERGKTYDGIDALAKAQVLLAQDERRHQFITALCGAGLAYEAAGLLYAARANLVGALDRCLYAWFKEKSVDPRALPLLKKLVWLEIQLGRVPYALGWVKWLGYMRAALSLDDQASRELEEEVLAMDRVLGILILRTKHEDWRSLTRLPDLLESLGLVMSRAAALFMLGHEQTVRTEYEAAADDLDDFASQWLATPAALDLPREASWHIGSTTMTTALLGCRVEIVVRGGVTSALLGEAILAFLEAFYSTAIRSRRFYSPREHLLIEVRQSDKAKGPFTLRVSEDDCGETKMVVTHPVASAAELMGPSSERAFIELFARVTAEMQLRVEGADFEKLFSEYRAQDRAYNAARSIVAVTNILGEQPPGRAEDWVSDEHLTAYEQRRQAAWAPKIIESVPKATADATEAQGPSGFSLEPPPPELSGADAVLHRDLSVASPINIPLWDRAKWKATGVALPAAEGDVPPPLMALVFQNIDAARKIFRGWRKKVGPVDREGWIQVTVITGINRERPFDYRVAIGVSERHWRKSGSGHRVFAMVNRMHDMNPSSDRNLQVLRQHFARAGFVILAPSEFKPDVPGLPLEREDLALAIQIPELHFVEAWTVGSDSPLLMSMQGIAAPVVPTGVTDVPFMKALQRLKELKRD